MCGISNFGIALEIGHKCDSGHQCHIFGQGFLMMILCFADKVSNSSVSGIDSYQYQLSVNFY